MAEKKAVRISLIGMVALCLVNFANMADLVIIPAADAIFGAYPQASMGVLNFILSGPQLIMVVSMLLSTVLMRKISKRTLLLLSFLVFTVSSCLGAVVDNVYYVSVMRAIVGFAGGFCTPVALSLINETYYDDQEKGGAMVGYFCSTSALFGLLMSVAAGYLCVSRWQNVFHVYYAAVPMLLFMFFFLPKTAKPQQSAQQNEKTAPMPWLRLLAVVLAVIVGAVLANASNYLSSVYLMEQGLGDSSVAGIFTAIITLMTAVVSALYGQLYKAFRRFTGALMFALLAVSYLLLMVATTKTCALIGAAVNGMAYGILVSYYVAVITSFVPVSQMTTATPVILAALGFGSFLCTYAAYGLMGLLGTATLASIFPYMMGIAILGCVVSALASQKLYQKQS